MNSTNGAAFTALGNIVISEGADSDFASGAGQTLKLYAPPGWRFKRRDRQCDFSGKPGYQFGVDPVTSSNLTVTFSVGGVSKSDVLTIGGLQVQPLTGFDAPLAGYIMRWWDDPGTANISGIEVEFTTFGLCNLIAGAARSLSMHTQPAETAIAGVPFDPQPRVTVADQFGNIRELDVTTVVTASRGAGTGALQGALSQVAIGGVATFTNLSHNALTTITIVFSSPGLSSVTSDPTVINPAPASRLVFATQPGSASVGEPFGIQPVVKTQDQFGNDTTVGLSASKLVTVALTSGTGALLGTTTLDIGTNAGNGFVSFSNLQIDAAGANKQLTASSPGFTSGQSLVFGVSASAFTKLQILLPGETAAPATPSGKTGSPTPQASGTPFNVTVNAVDANWNVVNTISDTVALTSSDGAATLPANAALVSGTKSFSVTLNTVGTSTLTVSDLSQPAKAPDTSSSVTVGGGTPRKLVMVTQPSANATAGVVFSQQPSVGVEDAGSNLVATDNGRVITATRLSGTGTLQGTVTAVTLNGVATFTNLSYQLAETLTINFTAAGLTNATSANVAVAAAPATRLVYTTQPAQVRSGSVFGVAPVIVAQDQFGNASLTGLPANLLVNLTLSSGSGFLLGGTSYDIGSAAGNGVVVCSNLICTEPGPGKQITATATGLSNAVSASFVVGGLVPASGGGAISADTTSGTFTLLTGPVFYEATSGDAGAGTIVLNAPTGFLFDTGGAAPSVVVTRQSGSGANSMNINGVASGTAAAITSRTTNQITFTVSTPSGGGVVCSLTWTNVRVRPLAGTPLASGSLTRSGTSTMAGITAGTSFGFLTEVAGLANRLAFSTQPGAAVAGAPFGVQPVINTRDQFGNNSVVGLAASKIVTLALTSGTGALLGTKTVDVGTGAGNGVGHFTDLQIDAALTTKQLTASASGFTNATSSFFAVNSAAAARLTIQTQPSSSVIAGVNFPEQPVIRIEDQFGNLRNLDNGVVVTASRNAGTGELQGTTSASSVGGMVSFSSLSHIVANNITINFASAGLTGATSANVLVIPAAASRLAIQTEPSATAQAGAPFAQQPVIRMEDQYGNLRASDGGSVTATRHAGSGTLQGTTTVTAAGGVASFSNLSHNVPTNITIRFTSGSLAAATSSVVAITPAPATRLVFTTQPGNAAAGSPFGTQPVLKTQDAFGNDSTIGLPVSLVATIALTGGTGTLLGVATVDLGTAAGNGVAAYTDLQINHAGTNKQLTASAAGLSSALSSVFSVNAAAAHHLTIQTQPSTTATAGSAFASQPMIRIEDQFGNVLTGDNATVVTAGIGQGSGLLQGTLNRTAANGIVSFSGLSYNIAETITLNFSSGSLLGCTSANVTVNASAASQLAILTQPSSVATAGVAFDQQPQIRIEDQYGNVRSNDNTTVVTAVRATGTGTLQGTTTATANGGVASFGNLSYRVAETMTIAFSSSGLSGATSANVAVSAGEFTKLQLLVPGETAVPGTTSGKVGTPTGQVVGTPFAVTVNAVDAHWNLANQVDDTVSLSSSDANATLPSNAGLASGSQQFIVTLNTPGTATLTANDVSDNSKSPSSSPSITVAPAPYTAATGGSAISADTAGGTFTSLTGPTYSEAASGHVGPGTIQLKAPAGFIFDTSGTAPTVLMTRIAGSGSSANNINDLSSGTVVPMTSVTPTQLVFTVTSSSASGIACSLTWQNIRVRPTAGTPLAAGDLSISGTANLVGVSTNSNLGRLREVPGAARLLAIQTEPSAASMAGVAFAIQPSLQVRDQFGNPRTNDSATVVTASRGSGTGTLQGTTTAIAANGLVSFSNLAHNVAGNITLNFGGAGLSNATSSLITISAGAATAIGFATQPGNATAGAVFGTQPVIKTLDAFGNFSVIGLPASLMVNLSLSSGSGPLQGITSFDLGTDGGNGTASFADLRIDSAGSNKQLTANAAALGTANSSLFTVDAGAASVLAIQVQPSLSAAAGATFAQQPVLRVEDQFGNLRATDNSTVVTVARNSGTGTLQGTTSATANAGVVTFANLSHRVAGTIDLIFNSGALTPVISSQITITTGPASKLTISSQPSATATAGTAFAQQPQIRIEDQYGNLRSTDNTTVVTAARGFGAGTLQGQATATASAGVASFGDLNYRIAETMTITFTSSGLTGATSDNVVVGPGEFAGLQVLVPGETAVAGSVSGKTGAPASQVADVPFNVSVRAVDAHWNVVASVNDLIGITSSDLNALLPAPVAFTSGTQQVSIALSTGGTNTVTAQDLTDNSKLPGTSGEIPVVAYHVAATGGATISADTVGGAFTALTGPSYTEAAPGSAAVGTIILNAPAGFIFDTGSPAPTVRIDRVGGSGINNRNINGVASGTSVAMTSVSSTQLTFTISSTSANGVTCKLTWQNVRVRPTAGTPLAVGKLTRSGTSTMAGVANGVSNFGLLREIAGSAARLGLQTQPSASAMAGEIFDSQPVVEVQDQFGNRRSSSNGAADNSSIVNASLASGAGVPQGSLTATAANGLAQFGNIAHLVANEIRLEFTSGALLSVTSAPVSITPAAVNRLVFNVQPGNGMVGGMLGPQPVIRSQDQYGNNSSVDLPANLLVEVSLSSGNGSLLGTAALDIGTAAGNGLANFTDLAVDVAGTDKRLMAAATGLNSVESSMFAVMKADQTINFAPLGAKVYGAASFELNATASSGLAVSYEILSGPAAVIGDLLTITGAGTVTVRASQAGDASWNSAPSADQSFGVSKAQLTMTAENKSRSYGAANPALTFAFEGLVNGDDSSAFTGAPELSTAATISSSVGASPYSITIAQGTLTSANYDFNFVAGTLTITQATSQVLLVASANPSTSGEEISFTATVSTAAAGNPGGTVQFRANGTAIGEPVALQAGTANIEVSSLTAGTNLIEAVYSGDANIAGSNASLNQVVNDATPATLEIGLAGNGVRITVNGAVGATYSIERCDGLQGAATAWQNVGSAIVEQSGKGEFVDTTPPAGQAYYRAVRP